MNDKDNKETPEKEPDDCGSILVETHVKIFDPETDEVFVNKR
jgi:hypothetical protein